MGGGKKYILFASTHDRVVVGIPFLGGGGNATFFPDFVSLNMRGTNRYCKSLRILNLNISMQQTLWRRRKREREETKHFD